MVEGHHLESIKMAVQLGVSPTAINERHDDSPCGNVDLGHEYALHTSIGRAFIYFDWQMN